jgi:hypothetical protein
MITVDRLIAWLQQVPDKQSWVLLDDEELVIFDKSLRNGEGTVGFDKLVLGSIHICGEDMADCEECSTDQSDLLRQVSNA